VKIDGLFSCADHRYSAEHTRSVNWQYTTLPRVIAALFVSMLRTKLFFKVWPEDSLNYCFEITTIQSLSNSLRNYTYGNHSARIILRKNLRFERI
jgi:hypothetical protein